MGGDASSGSVVMAEEAARSEARKRLRSSEKLFYSYDECVARAEEVYGPGISKQHLMNRANRPGTFKAGKRAGAAFPKLYPVDAVSFERWLHGKSGR